MVKIKAHRIYKWPFTKCGLQHCYNLQLNPIVAVVGSCIGDRYYQEEIPRNAERCNICFEQSELDEFFKEEEEE